MLSKKQKTEISASTHQFFSPNERKFLFQKPNLVSRVVGIPVGQACVLGQEDAGHISLKQIVLREEKRM